MSAKWHYFESISRIPIFPMDSCLYGVGIGIKPIVGCKQDWLFWYKNFECRLYCAQNERTRTGEAVLAKCGDAAFLKKFESELKRNAEALVRHSQKFVESERLSNEELAAALDEYSRLGNVTYSWGVLPNLLDYTSDEADNVLLAKLDAYLRRATGGAKQSVVWMKDLTTPDEESFTNREQKEFLELALEFNKNRRLVEALRSQPLSEISALIHEPRFAKENALLAEHARKWEWLSFLFMGPVKWTKHYFLHRLHDALKHEADIEGELAHARALPQYVRKARDAALEAVRLDAEHAALFEAARKMIFLKAWRKDMQVRSYYYASNAVREAAKRLSLSPELVYCMTTGELASALRGIALRGVALHGVALHGVALRGETAPAATAAPDKYELEERRRECALYTEGNRVLVATGDALKRLTADIEGEEKKFVEVKKIKGTCACPGHAFGTVRVVNNAEEMHKMQRGDVLVSQMTNPEIVVAMKRAAAIVTDFGGLTCHAAIVSRELNIPCVVGTRIATKALRDGDKVSVNATLGEVTKA
ncbi:MAG: PEP-utilizing enzyme [Candidatus Micrarchaeota archaeon]